jgi:hypothetical protein
MAGARIIVIAAAMLLLAAAPARAARLQWVAGDLHVHTTYSHDSYGGLLDDNTGPEEAYTLGHSVASQFALARIRGLDFMAISDHNDVRSQSDPGFGDGPLGIPAYENSLNGHAQMLGATHVYDSGDKSAAAVQRIAGELRGDGGVFQVNHPSEGATGDQLDWEYAYDVVPDTVEAWNISPLYQPPLPSASDNDGAIRYWEGWLDRGRKVGATGGSDNHYLATTAIQGAGQPTTWVAVRRKTVAGVLEGLRKGRTFVSHQPPAHAGPRVFLEGDRNRNGRYETIAGGTVRAKRGRRARLRVRVHGAPGAKLRIVTGGGILPFDPVTITRARFSHRFTLPAGARWVRAEVVGEDLSEVRRQVCDAPLGAETTYCRNTIARLALTSAIYLR